MRSDMVWITGPVSDEHRDKTYNQLRLAFQDLLHKMNASKLLLLLVMNEYNSSLRE